MCVTRVYHVCDMCVTCIVHMCGMYRPYVWHDSFARVARLIHICTLPHFRSACQSHRRGCRCFVCVCVCVCVLGVCVCRVTSFRNCLPISQTWVQVFCACACMCVGVVCVCRVTSFRNCLPISQTWGQVFCACACMCVGVVWVCVCVSRYLISELPANLIDAVEAAND